MRNSITTGKYKHFKGDECEVLGVALHSETLEEMVVYWHAKNDGKRALWVRPLTMFLEEVEVGGKRVPRFRYIAK